MPCAIAVRVALAGWEMALPTRLATSCAADLAIPAVMPGVVLSARCVIPAWKMMGIAWIPKSCAIYKHVSDVHICQQSRWGTYSPDILDHQGRKSHHPGSLCRFWGARVLAFPLSLPLAIFEICSCLVDCSTVLNHVTCYRLGLWSSMQEGDIIKVSEPMPD